MNATTHPLSQLTAAEAALVASIDAATARLDAVGTSALDAALERLRVAAGAAASRLAGAGAAVAAIAGGVLDAVMGEAKGIEAAVGRELGNLAETAKLPTAEVEPAAADAVPPVSPETPGTLPEPAPAFVAGHVEPVGGESPTAPAEDVAAGPTLFDAVNANDDDPTAVLVGPVYVPYVPSANRTTPAPVPDEPPAVPCKSPTRKRKR